MQTFEIEIERIRRDGGTQARAQLDMVTISDYAEAMRGGAEFPPVVVFNDGEHRWLADGFHRVAAAEAAGKTTIEAILHGGTTRDAVLFSVGANADHGLRRNSADKRAAVLRLLEDAEWATWSDREIARRCAVSHQTVSNLRGELTVKNGQSDAPALRKGADGRVIDTSNIGKATPATPPPALPSLGRKVAAQVDALPLPDWAQEEAAVPEMGIAGAEEAPLTILQAAERLRKLVKGSADAAMGKVILDDLVAQKQGWYHELVRCYVPETMKPAPLGLAASIVRDELYGPENPTRAQRAPAPQLGEGEAEEGATWAAGAVGLNRDWSAEEFDEYVKANEPVMTTVTLDGPDKPVYDAIPVDDDALLRPVSLRDGYDSDEWYTPQEVIAAVRDVLGEIDLDPASCALANQVVGAARYYDKVADGLRKGWTGRVFLNPPYSEPARFVEVLLTGYVAGRVTAAIVLVNNATETYWFQKLLRFPVCFPAKRMQFWRHDYSGVGARQGQAIFYLGPDKSRFAERFGTEFGPVLEVIS